MDIQSSQRKLILKQIRSNLEGADKLTPEIRERIFKRLVEQFVSNGYIQSLAA